MGDWRYLKSGQASSGSALIILFHLMAKKHIDRAALIATIRELKELSNEQKSDIIQLISERKKFGIVWEESEEDAQEFLKNNLPVLVEDVDKRLDNGGDEAPNHVLIEGDNLHALTALTYTHAGQFDCIYIDPPYNTGATAWRYNNDYVDKEDSYKHSKWLTMMYNRLTIAKKLLNQKNSALIVTIDEVECPYLSCMLSELFPYSKIQMVTSVICPGGRGKKAAADFSNTEEFIFFVRLGECVVSPEIKDETQTPLGWRSLIRGTLANGRGMHGIGSCGPNQFYPIYVNNKTKRIEKIGAPLPENQSRYTAPEISGCTAVFPIRPDGTEMNWGCVPDEAEYRLKHGYLKVGSYTPSKPQQYVIQYLTKGVIKDIHEGRAIVTGYSKDGYVEGYYPEGKPTMPTTVWNRSTHNATQYGTNLLTNIFGCQKFDYPKSVFAVSDCIKFISNGNKDLKILDFFAGSGTTLHATMQLNAEDGGHRQCILCTNNENNICEEVTYERNKRVINGYTTPKGEDVTGLTKNNLRYYKVDFVPRVSSTSGLKELMLASTDLLCIKNDLYEEQSVFGNIKLRPRIARYFDDGKQKMLIIYKVDAIESIVEEIKKMPDDTFIKVYVFSTNNYAMDADFEEVSDKVFLCALPAAIHNAYKKVLPRKNNVITEEEEE